MDSLFSEEYLLERPLLKSIRSQQPVVLLIDEVDKADEEFEAFLLDIPALTTDPTHSRDVFRKPFKLPSVFRNDKYLCI